MQVVHNEQKFKIRWQYKNTTLEKWLDVAGIDESAVKKMTKPDLAFELRKVMRLVRAKCLPTPDITICVISNEQNEEIAREMVRLVPGEKHDVEKARCYSLTKVLFSLFPPSFDNDERRKENKLIRTLFWKTYRERKVKTVLQPVNKPEAVMA